MSRTSPSTRQHQRRRIALLSVAVATVLLVLAGSCSAGDDEATNADPTATPAMQRSAGRSYAADWDIDAEAMGAEGLGFPFSYREVFDDRSGRYLVQSPQHLAFQEPDRVVFCAAILRAVPFCGQSERAEGTPNVLAYPLQLLREWGPTQLYELASWRELVLVAERDPANWERRTGVTLRGLTTDCFSVTGDTGAAPMGFSVCFTDDDLHLVATVDLQGDDLYEIDLVNYSRPPKADDFVTGLDGFIEEKPSLQDQLLELYPEVPAPRTEPTSTE